MKNYELNIDTHTLLMICAKQHYIHVMKSKSIGKIIINKN